MIRIAIIDDEKAARDVLKAYIQLHFPNLELVGEADDVRSGVECIRQTKPDIVFLDVKMPDGTGFDLLDGLRTRDFEVVFVTAFDHFAIKAFEFSAIGYLLKPVSLKALRTTVKQLEGRFAKDGEKRLKVLIENFGATDGLVKKLVIPTIEGFSVFEIKDIVRLEGERNYTRFIGVGDKSILVSRTLKEYEELLGEHGFFRIHQSHLINLHYVVKYIKGDGGRVLMSDGSELQVARQRKGDFLKRFL